MSGDSPLPIQPPRYVPTLTEVVAAGGQIVPVPMPVVQPAPPEELADIPNDAPAELPVDAAAGIVTVTTDTTIEDEERLLRVLQRVEVLMDQRLAAAVAHAAESVTREFADRLRREIAPLIKEAVNAAVAEELNPDAHSGTQKPY